MYLIGAKDNIDRALVRQYASAQTSNFSDDIKMDSEDVWEKLNLLATGQKTHINLMGKLKKVS